MATSKGSCSYLGTFDGPAEWLGYRDPPVGNEVYTSTCFFVFLFVLGSVGRLGR